MIILNLLVLSDYYNFVLERTAASVNERIQLTLLGPLNKIDTNEM